MFSSEHKDKQVEFFNDLPGTSRKPKRKFNLARIALSLSYENIIIFSIGLIMLLVACYSLGVEKGKHLVRVQSEEINIEAEPKPSFGFSQDDSKTGKPTEPQEKKIKVKVAQKSEDPKKLPYIQVASFRTDKYARKEMQELKNNGYRSFLSKWGNFSVVCVGRYKNRDEARAALKNLKRLYADCILHDN
ncbi:MAG: SPOR domain-containing protein [Candidatus Omnitrophica bacterium]|nr:SPOR domain-containing protein [Candidatus Omnitrophota bacterium]